MKYLNTLAFCLLVIATSAQKPTMDFESYNPPSTLVVPQHIVTKAKFPFIDIHNHQWNMGSKNLEELTSVMDTLNMAVMNNLSGGSGASLQESIKNIREHAPKRFTIFANVDFSGIGDHGWSEKAAKQLEEDIRNGASGLKIFKNLGLSVKDKSGNRVAVDDPRLDAVWAVCGKMKDGLNSLRGLAEKEATLILHHGKH